MTSENLARIFSVVLVDDVNFCTDVQIIKFLIDNF